MDKLLQDIGLCRRAGKLCMGTDSVKDALKYKRAAVVIISAQISEKSQKEMRFLSEKYESKLCVIPHSFEEIGTITRKPIGIMCITDASLGEKFLRDLAATDSGGLH